MKSRRRTTCADRDLGLQLLLKEREGDLVSLDGDLEGALAPVVHGPIVEGTDLPPADVRHGEAAEDPPRTRGDICDPEPVEQLVGLAAASSAGGEDAGPRERHRPTGRDEAATIPAGRSPGRRSRAHTCVSVTSTE